MKFIQKTLMTYKSKLKSRFSKDIDEGIKSLEEFINPNNENEFFQLKARYNDLQKRERKGVVSQENYSLGINKLRNDFFGFIDQLDENVDHNEGESSQITNTFALKPRLEIEQEDSDYHIKEKKSKKILLLILRVFL